MIELIVTMAGMYVVVALAALWMRSKRRRLTADQSVTDRGGID